MRILVTGATGFIGKHLVKTLAELPENHQILALCNHMPTEYEVPHKNVDLYYCNLLNPDLSIVRTFKPDIVYHLAAVSSPALTGMKVWEINTHITMNLLDNVDGHFVYLSTANILGEYPHEEEQITTVYAASKKASECLVETYFNQKKIHSGSIIRTVGVLGPGMTHGLVYDIVRKLKSDEPVLKLMKNTTKTYTYIDMLCANLLSELVCVEYKNPNVRFLDKDIVSDTNPLSAQRIAEIAMEELGITKPIEFSDISFPGDIMFSNPAGTYENAFKYQFLKIVRDVIRSYKE